MNATDLANIVSCPLFNSVDKVSLGKDIQAGSYRMKTYGKACQIMFRNDSYDELIIIVSGALEAFQDDKDGHQLLVETLVAPEAVATAILFAPEAKIPVSLKTSEPSRLFFLSRNNVLRLAARYTPIMENLLADMGARTAFLANKLRFQSFATIRQKLAAYLLEFIEAGSLTIIVNKGHLSEMFGVNRPSLSRVCGEMSEEGIIRLSGRELVILEPERIRAEMRSVAEG